MKEIIVRMKSDHIRVKDGEYVRDYDPNEADRAYYVGWKNGEEAERSRHKPKRGEWVESGFEEIKCSVCGSAWDYCDNDCERFNFCPNCGARMKGADDE